MSQYFSAKMWRICPAFFSASGDKGRQKLKTAAAAGQCCVIGERASSSTSIQLKSREKRKSHVKISVSVKAHKGDHVKISVPLPASMWSDIPTPDICSNFKNTLLSTFSLSVNFQSALIQCFNASPSRLSKCELTWKMSNNLSNIMQHQKRISFQWW